jgi:peroxiredoxin family protein
MSSEGGKLALIVNTASYDRVSFALNVATAAAAVGREVNLLFGYGGLFRLKKGAADVVAEETAGWMREPIKLGLEKGSLPRISQLLDTLLRLGGRVYACPAAMALHNLVKGELIDEVEQVCSLAEFMRQMATDGSTVIYV